MTSPWLARFLDLYYIFSLQEFNGTQKPFRGKKNQQKLQRWVSSLLRTPLQLTMCAFSLLLMIKKKKSLPPLPISKLSLTRKKGRKKHFNYEATEQSIRLMCPDLASTLHGHNLDNSSCWHRKT